MRRVLRAGGHVACIEPDISTSTLNLADRSLVRQVMGNEADTNVAHGWLPGQLGGMLKNVGFSDIRLSTRVVVFSPELAASYFLAMRSFCLSQSCNFRFRAAILDL